MGVLGRREDDHYLPESGILVVLDVREAMHHEETSDNEAHPVGSIGRSGHGWLYVAGGDGPCVVQLQACDDRPSDEEIDAWGADHYRGPDWLDQTFHKSSRYQPEWPNLAEIAGQVGVPEPTIRRDLLPLYLALRMITFDGSRYRPAEHPPSAEDVLQLPEQAVTFLKASRAVKQYTGYAADIVSVAIWGGTQQTVASLAERTCASEDEYERLSSTPNRATCCTSTGPATSCP
jgi:hypothetical protein